MKQACNPRWVLLLDAIGAGLTASTILLLLAPKRIPTGLPSHLLVAMGVAALSFGFFDAASLWLRANPTKSLRAIAVANATYCVMAFAALWVHRSTVNGWGLLYLSVEIPLIASIAAWEWYIAVR